MATFGGWLPGSSFIAGAASQERGGAGLRERIRLAPYSRTAIQMGIAVGLAIIAGDALSGRRFYWAVIAVFITFMGANTAGEQVRKSVFRVAGTFLGVIVGAVLAHLVGDRVALQVAVVLVSLFLGLYLFRINYAFMTIGITVMVSQLYVELGEFSNSLLVLRLEETAIGAGVAIATVLLVLPLHIGRVARVAARQQVEALTDLIDRCLDRLADPASAAGSDLELRASARRLDMAYQALSATVRPMRTPLLGRLASHTARFMATTSPPGTTRATCCSTRPPGTSSSTPRPRRNWLRPAVSSTTRSPRSPALLPRTEPPTAPGMYARPRCSRTSPTCCRSRPRSAAPSWRCATCSCSTARWPRPPAGRASPSPQPNSRSQRSAGIQRLDSRPRPEALVAVTTPVAGARTLRWHADSDRQGNPGPA